MAQESTNLPPTANQKSKGFFAKNRVTLILLLVIAVSNASIYLYQNNKISDLRLDFEKNYQSQVAKVDNLVEKRVESATVCLGRALSFACAAELASGNKQRLNLFFIDMVQNTEASLISIVDTMGYVYLSTDKDYENQSILDVVPSLPGRVNEPTLLKVNAKEFLYAAPIKYGRRIGTLVLDYKLDNKSRKMLDEISAYPKVE